jgi:hypothetical protein
MKIAQNAHQLDDLLTLTIFMKQMQGSDNVADFDALLNKCGYLENDDILSIENAVLSIDADNDPVLGIEFKFENDDGNVEVGHFYVRVKDGAVSGDF